MRMQVLTTLILVSYLALLLAWVPNVEVVFTMHMAPAAHSPERLDSATQ